MGQRGLCQCGTFLHVTHKERGYTWKEGLQDSTGAWPEGRACQLPIQMGDSFLEMEWGIQDAPPRPSSSVTQLIMATLEQSSLFLQLNK
jgi:hypothetical protein